MSAGSTRSPRLRPRPRLCRAVLPSCAGPAALPASAIALALLAGCGGGPPPEPERVYSLPPTVAAAPLPRPPLDGVLLVDTPVADGVLSDTRIAWRDLREPLVIRRLDDRRWSDPPPRLVQDALQTCLRSGNAASAVVLPEVRTGAATVLSGRIGNFEMQVAAPGRAEAVVALDLALTAAADRRVLWQRSFAERVPLPENTVAAAAEGFRLALGRLCTDLLGTLAARR